VHDEGLFELDGNAGDEAAAGEDWQPVNSRGRTGGSTGVIADPGSISIFTGGGSKDILDIPQWRHKNGSVPDKDNITNAYAEALVQNSDLILYFGADRFAQDGDSQIGFWFFQNEITLGNGVFNGEHAVGDILVLSDFTQGGTVSTVKVYEWVGSGGSDGALNFIDGGPVVSSGDVFCLGDDFACASINKEPVPAFWPYVPKAGTPGTFPTGGFFEGGVNVTKLLKDPTVCFASFLAETRSSQAPNAVLKDFAIDSFQTCGIKATKTCDKTELNPPGSPKLYTVSFTVTVENTGVVPLPAGAVVTVTDDAGTPGDTSDDVTLPPHTLAAPLPVGGTLTLTGSLQTDSNPLLDNVAHVSVKVDDLTTLTATSEPADCPFLPVDLAMTVSKACETSLVNENGQVVVQVGISGEICNIGDVQLDVTAVDVPAAIVTIADPQLDPNECTAYKGSYQPMSVPSPDPGSAVFTDTITATGTNNVLGRTVTATATATCSLCPE
jgi:hypothetical protein